MRRCVAVAVLLGSASGLAAELQVELGLGGRMSTWASDGGGGAAVRLGFRPWRAVALDVVVWEELHAVDLRGNTGLAVGATAFVPLGALRPMLRAFFVHQHEQAVVSVKKSPLSAVVGIGDGIRHRAGFGFSAGAEWALLKRGPLEVFVAPALTATFFPDERLGPGAYVGLSLMIGANYDLSGGKT